MDGFFRPNRYYRPKNIREATQLLSTFGERARIIAGGTDLLVEEPSEIDSIIDLENLNLSFIRKNKEGIDIGATTTINLIDSSPVFSMSPYHVLKEAAQEMATPAIRNMGTIGGNICNASPAADLSVALMVLDTNLKISGFNGTRILPIGDFFKDVNKTSLIDDELLVALHIPLYSGSDVASFLKLKHHQTSIDIAIVNVAVRLSFSEKICEEARIALGAVAKTPIHIKKAETILGGMEINAALIENAAYLAAQESSPIDDVRASASYRKKMVAVLVKRALENCMKGRDEWLKST